MDNDDKMIGRLLSRRSTLRLLGGATLGAGLMGRSFAQSGSTSGSLPGCVVRPAMTEGPYFVDEKLNRSDIRADSKTKAVKPGVPLALTFLVSQVATNLCKPLPGAQVDIWHCDAGGLYSDERANNTVGQDFLRGYQVTGGDGRAKFTTVYPGWYPGRTVHVHFKLRLNGREFTSQLFFGETTTDKVFALEPYSGRGRRTTMNAADNIYRNGGSQLLLDLTGDPAKGYAATFEVGMNLA